VLSASRVALSSNVAPSTLYRRRETGLRASGEGDAVCERAAEDTDCITIRSQSACALSHLNDCRTVVTPSLIVSWFSLFLLLFKCFLDFLDDTSPLPSTAKFNQCNYVPFVHSLTDELNSN
jgi:hypothetical protein